MEFTVINKQKNQIVQQSQSKARSLIRTISESSREI